MKRIWLLALLATALVAIAAPVEASAKPTLAQKVQRLQKQVGKLQAQMSCLRRTGASTYFGYAYYDGTLEPGGGPYPVHDPADDWMDTNLATNFDQVLGVTTSDYWLVTVHNSRGCRRQFGIVRNPYAARIAERADALKARRLARLQ